MVDKNPSFDTRHHWSRWKTDTGGETLTQHFYKKTNSDSHQIILLTGQSRELWLELNKQRRSKMWRSRSWPLLSDSSEPDLMPMNDQITSNQRMMQSFDGSRSMFVSQRHGIFYSFDEDSVEEQEFPASVQRQARRSTKRRKLGLF